MPFAATWMDREMIILSDVSQRRTHIAIGFPGSPVSKESARRAGELGSIPGLGGFPGEGNGKPLA